MAASTTRTSSGSQIDTYRDSQAAIEAVMSDLRYVEVDHAMLDAVARTMHDDIQEEWWRDATYTGAPYHYQKPTGGHATLDALAFNFVNTAQMWLIWERTAEDRVIPLTMMVEGEICVGASSITSAHRRALRQGVPLLSAQYLASMSVEDVRAVFQDERDGTVKIQNVEGRLEKYREMGRVLLEEFDGDVANIYRRAKGQLYSPAGDGLIDTIERYFPVAYADFPYFKLPQVAIYGALGALRAADTADDELRKLLQFRDLEKLEGGADYYRPYFLMRVGLINPLGELRQRLIDERLIDDERMEAEFRAATIYVMRELSKRLGKHEDVIERLETVSHVTALAKCRNCKVGISDERLPCSYKPVCKAFQGDDSGARMGVMWPLVKTTQY